MILTIQPTDRPDDLRGVTLGTPYGDVAMLIRYGRYTEDPDDVEYVDKMDEYGYHHLRIHVSQAVLPGDHDHVKVRLNGGCNIKRLPDGTWRIVNHHDVDVRAAIATTEPMGMIRGEWYKDSPYYTTYAYGFYYEVIVEFVKQHNDLIEKRFKASDAYIIKKTAFLNAQLVQQINDNWKKIEAAQDKGHLALEEIQWILDQTQYLDIDTSEVDNFYESF